MARIIRIMIDVAERWEDTDNLTVRVSEQIRTSKQRELMCIHPGEDIRDEDIDLTAQVVEDAIRSAISRTLGIVQTLHF